MHTDHHIEVGRAYYSVHYSLIGQRVDARLSAHLVEIFQRGVLIASHRRAVRRYQRSTIEAHRPPEHRAYLALGIPQLLERAERVGPATREILERQLARKRHPGELIREALGILRLAQDFTAARLEQTATAALELGLHRYGALKELIKQAPASSPSQAKALSSSTPTCAAPITSNNHLSGEMTMLIEPMMQLLGKLRLHGMSAALERQMSDPDVSALRFEERLNLLLQHELAERDNARVAQRLRLASLPLPACLEDLDTRIARNLDQALLSTLRDLSWIARHLNVLITGPTGIGKSFIAAALAHAACRADLNVRCFRLSRLMDELARAAAFQRRSNFLRSLAKADLLLIDDFAIAPLSDQIKRDLLEILDDRYDKSATIIISQLPVKQWHAYLDDPTLADAILDRLVHNAYHLDLSGESIRKLKGSAARSAKPTSATPRLHA